MEVLAPKGGILPLGNKSKILLNWKLKFDLPFRLIVPLNKKRQKFRKEMLSFDWVIPPDYHGGKRVAATSLGVGKTGVLSSSLLGTTD